MNCKKQIVMALALGGFFLFIPPLQAQEAAFFRGVSGTVEVKTPGSGVWVQAAEGDRIEKDAFISTGFKSTAALAVGNSVITVRPLTRLTLEEIVRDRNGEQVNLFLQTGRVRVEVKPPVGEKTGFAIRSPIATASVRGTSFEFDTERLVVEEGRVHYSLANGRWAYVAAGGMSYIDEISNTVKTPFEAAAELLKPAPPPGSDSGGPAGDGGPAIPSSPADVDMGIGFNWE